MPVKQKVNKKHAKKQKDNNAHVNKNCEIFMCNMKEKIEGKTEVQLMKELEEIF